jgi:pimeloyl-ACP methyl ester carboxylesterase
MRVSPVGRGQPMPKRAEIFRMLDAKAGGSILGHHPYARVLSPMMSPRSCYLAVAGHEMHLTEWGAPDAPALVMWHGLARTGRDFDTLACHLADRFRVICPDTIGRGWSSWSGDPDADYTLPAYCAQATALLDGLGVERCRWIGTSMGGLIGMLLAAGPLKGRIERLVMNDVGPRLNAEAIQRIRAYVTTMPSFATMSEYETFLRVVYAPFGSMTEHEWKVMLETSARRRDDGRITAHYDPQVMQVFARSAGDEVDLWPAYDAIECPTLLLRGAMSDLLLPEAAQEMTGRGPRATLVTIPGCGHAPALNTPEQIAVVDAFLST